MRCVRVSDACTDDDLDMETGSLLDGDNDLVLGRRTVTEVCETVSVVDEESVTERKPLTVSVGERVTEPDGVGDRIGDAEADGITEPLLDVE